MPRHKKDKNKKKEEALQDLQQDHEQFLLAFEKPTQIYRFLRARHIISPVFMHRTLLYMRDRCSRTNARRKQFSLKDLLNVALSDESSVQQINSAKTEDLLLAISGVCLNFSSEKDAHKSESRKYKRLDVEVLLSKTILNKRKDTDFLPKQVSQGVVEVPVNPRVSYPHKSFDENEGVISIPSSAFVATTQDGSAVKSCSIIFKVREVSSNSEDSEESESEESESDSGSEEEVGRQRKRKKTSKESEDDPAGISLKNLTSGPRKRRIRASVKKISERRRGDIRSDEEEEKVSKPERKKTYRSSNKPPILKTNPSTLNPVIYETELLIFNSEHERLVQDGDYELTVTTNESDVAEDYKRKAVWESFDGGREIKVYGAFSEPTLKLQLKWSSSDDLGPLANYSDEESNDSLIIEGRRRRTRTAQLQEKANLSENSAFKMKVDHIEYRKLATAPYKSSLSNGTGQNGVGGKVFYQFMYNNNTQQQTESRDDFYCPWCQLNCMTLYGLMKHLKLCHPRFMFNCSQQQKGTIIIVTVNECYDGSYTGNPQNIFSQPGFAFSRRGPVRRIPVTEILVFKPQRTRDQNLTLAELLDREDAEALETAQFSTGHRRLYFHSLTTLPIRPCEFDLDSDGEGKEPDWLFGHTKRMIDEFTDVNEGEKALMKIWNLHVMRHACIADCQIEKECERFIDKNIQLLSHHGLRSNLLLHFICLVDFGVFKTSTVLSLMDYYDKVNAEHKKNSSSEDKIPDMMSKDFPEPDLLPRIDQLNEIIKEAQ